MTKEQAKEIQDMLRFLKINLSQEEKRFLKWFFQRSAGTQKQVKEINVAKNTTVKKEAAK